MFMMRHQSCNAKHVSSSLGLLRSPWLLVVIEATLTIPGIVIIASKLFATGRKLAAYDYYRFAAWFLGCVLFNTVVQGIVVPFGTRGCTSGMAVGIMIVTGLIAYIGHWMVYSYSLDRLVSFE